MLRDAPDGPREPRCGPGTTSPAARGQVRVDLDLDQHPRVGSAATTTIVVTGRMSPNTSPWARPTPSQCPVSVTNMRVRTTSASPAPTRASAASTFSSAWRVCWYGSPGPATTPSAA